MNPIRLATDAAKAHRSPTWFSWLPSVIAISAVGTALAGDGFMTPARFVAMAAFFLQASVELRAQRNRFLTSPLFLLSLLATTFFSFVQGLWGQSVRYFRASHFMEGVWGTEIQLPLERDFTVYVGSKAELVVLAFGMACLILYSISSRKTENSTKIISEKYFRKSLFLPILLMIFAINISIINYILFNLGFHDSDSPWIYSQIKFATPPLLSVCLFFLVRSAIGRGRLFATVVGATAVMAIASLMLVHEGKLVLFIALAAALYTIRLCNLSPSRLLLAAPAIVIVGFIMLQTVQAIRRPPNAIIHMPLAREIALAAGARFMNVSANKLVWRQTETGFCFRNVMRSHLDRPFAPSKQLFWLKGLVPRLIWPGKPSLSLGGIYATRYCGIPADKVGDHNASITLLGQPVIYGGWTGLLVHVGLLLIALAAIERLNADPRTLPAMMTAAMLPWLIDFDQDFALYVANAVKFGLVMAAVTVPVAMIEKRLLAGPE